MIVAFYLAPWFSPPFICLIPDTFGGWDEGGMIYTCKYSDAIQFDLGKNNICCLYKSKSK